MKKTLREVIEKYNLNVRITPNQNLILCDIRSAWRRPITTVLAQAGLLVRSLLESSILIKWLSIFVYLFGLVARMIAYLWHVSS